MSVFEEKTAIILAHLI